MSKQQKTVAIRFKNPGGLYGPPAPVEYTATGWEINDGWVSVQDGASVLAAFPADEVSSVTYADPKPEVDLVQEVADARGVADSAKYIAERADKIAVNALKVAQEEPGAWATIGFLLISVSAVAGLVLGLIAVV